MWFAKVLDRTLLAYNKVVRLVTSYWKSQGSSFLNPMTTSHPSQNSQCPDAGPKNALHDSPPTSKSTATLSCKPHAFPHMPCTLAPLSALQQASVAPLPAVFFCPASLWLPPCCFQSNLDFSLRVSLSGLHKITCSSPLPKDVFLHNTYHEAYYLFTCLLSAHLPLEGMLREGPSPFCSPLCCQGLEQWLI